MFSHMYICAQDIIGELHLDEISFQLNYKKVTLHKIDGLGAQEIG